MRALGLVGLVLALVIVALLAKKQMGGIATPAMPANPAVTPGPSNARIQSQQIQEQFKQSLDAATQPRPLPDDAR